MSSTNYFSKKGSSTQIKPFGTKFDTEYISSIGSDKTPMSISSGKPQAKAPAGDSYLYESGQQALVFEITAKLKDASGYGYMSYLNFTLMDGQQNVCQRDSSSPVIKVQDKLPEGRMSGDEIKGQIAFVVPKGQDYSKYTLMFSSNSDTGATAQVGWSG
ncbi:hypothetical protein G9U51_09775 [Calidifontibacter sp. DB0510]|uniref:DUF4352 domain-containing protein n=1 Tax=Metallococcus carri TaxID=1656884 RepID=A0A967B0I3_9MICO|nr:hypothetical protein [Metallococcus carri]NHN56063.1 hypothetical protein [Metallococcus carri]NOP37480.1 hypothetical protein [Calidifontibacter sp. DB2511S]